MTRAPHTEPTRLEQARDCLKESIAALDRGHLARALRAMEAARIMVETETQFRCARRGAA